MDRSRPIGSASVALDLGMDTTTPGGETEAGVASVFAQFRAAADLAADEGRAGGEAGAAA